MSIRVGVATSSSVLYKEVYYYAVSLHCTESPPWQV